MSFQDARIKFEDRFGSGRLANALNRVVGPPDAVGDHAEVDDGGEVAVAFGHLRARRRIAHDGHFKAQFLACVVSSSMFPVISLFLSSSLQM